MSQDKRPLLMSPEDQVRAKELLDAITNKFRDMHDDVIAVRDIVTEDANVIKRRFEGRSVVPRPVSDFNTQVNKVRFALRSLPEKLRELRLDGVTYKYFVSQCRELEERLEQAKKDFSRLIRQYPLVMALK